MSSVIDHLESHHRVRVLRHFLDARGFRHRPGETGVIRRMRCNFTRNQFVIEWERDGKTEEITLDLKSPEGPGIGRMREYFAKGEYVPLPGSANKVQTRAQRAARRVQRPTPELVEEPVTDMAHYRDAVARIWALAARQRFDEANEQIRIILCHRTGDHDPLERLADDMIGLAEMFLCSPDGAVYDWLRERTISLWYAWGSQATSGGEGAAMALRIRAAEERLPARRS
jgi:hypothetical protein